MSKRSSSRNPSLLRNRGFLLLWCAYAVSALGDHLSEMAVLNAQGALNPNVDVTPIQARLTFVFFLPWVLLSPVAGWVADRRSRRAIMVGADMVRCVIMFFFTALTAAIGASQRWGPVAPYLLLGVFAAFFSPARNALLPTLIPSDQLIRANGLLAGVGIIATMAAQLLGGWLADRYYPDVAFRCDALSFLVSAVLLCLIAVPAQTPAVSASAPNDSPAAAGRGLRRGFQYTWRHRRAMELILAAAVVWFCGALVRSVIPAIVRDVYLPGLPQYASQPFSLISRYWALIGLGFIVGSLVVSTLGEGVMGEVTITWGLFGIGASMLLLAASVFNVLSPVAASRVGAVAAFLGGMSAVSVMAATAALIQHIVPDRFRGRVFGVNDLATMSALLLATGTLGVPRWERVDRWVGPILLIVAACALVSGFVAIRIRLARSPHRAWILFLENINQFLTRFWWRMKVVNKPTVPHRGSVLVVANHTCYGDPLLLLGAVPYRPFGFMVAREYTVLPVLGFFMRIVDCIPVKRDGLDTAATRRAMRILRDEGALGIFVEGRITPPGQQSDLKDGVAMLALATGARVIPAHISGTRYYKNLWKGMLTRHHARVRFGPPIDLSEFHGSRDRETVRRVTQRIFDMIMSLGEERGSHVNGAGATP